MREIKWIKIEDLDIHISDGNYSSKYPRSSEFVSSGVPFIRANNFLNKSISPKEMYFITPEKHQNLLKGHLKTGDVLITTRGDLGKTVIVPESYNDANINAQIVLLRANPQQIDPKFLIWCFDTKEVKFQISQLQTGTALQQLPVGKLLKIKIPIPPLEEQKRIAEILDRASSLISKRKDAIAKFDTLTQSIFIEMFGNPVTNPKKWERIILGDVIASASDGPHVSPKYAEAGIPFLSTRHIRHGRIDWTDLKFISPDEAEIQWKKCKPQRGDILYTKGGTTGIAATVDFDEPFAVWVHVALLKTNKNKVEPKWLENMLNSSFCYQQSQRLTHGIANRDLGLKRMTGIEMFLPPLSLQKQFAQRIEAVEKLKATHRTSLTELQALFASLQHRAFRGEL